jgi:starvation-inducible DNA-binding protein
MNNTKLVTDLTKSLGDTVVFKFLAQGYHWNVRGLHFPQFHRLFGKVYEEAEGATDGLAELVRKLGHDAPFLLTDLAQLSDIQPRQTASNEPEELTAALYAANNVVLQNLVAAFKCADECNEQGVADFLAARIDAHQKWRWQLGTVIGADSTQMLGNPTDVVVVTPALDYEMPMDDPEMFLSILASAHQVNTAVLRAAYRRAVKDGENPVARATELASKKYQSRDADLLPRRK